MADLDDLKKDLAALGGKPMETEKEIQKQELQIKINEAKALRYLAETDWIEAYKIRHDLGLELIPEGSSKWEILNKREEYKLFLKEGN